VRSAAEQIAEQAEQSRADQQRCGRDHQQHRNDVHGQELDAIRGDGVVGKI